MSKSQIRKIRLRELRLLTCVHRAGNWTGHFGNLDLAEPEPMILPLRLTVFSLVFTVVSSSVKFRRFTAEVNLLLFSTS